ncbi:hypothetical protein BT69DRAFT_1283710, partial [Atractiella rhizophila]
MSPFVLSLHRSFPFLRNPSTNSVSNGRLGTRKHHSIAYDLKKHFPSPSIPPTMVSLSTQSFFRLADVENEASAVEEVGVLEGKYVREWLGILLDVTGFGFLTSTFPHPPPPKRMRLASLPTPPSDSPLPKETNFPSTGTTPKVEASIDNFLRFIAQRFPAAREEWKKENGGKWEKKGMSIVTKRVLEEYNAGVPQNMRRKIMRSFDVFFAL